MNAEIRISREVPLINTNHARSFSEALPQIISRHMLAGELHDIDPTRTL